MTAGQPDVEAMNLATVAANDRVLGREVLLKDCDELGFVFFINYVSRKGQELARNPFATFIFYWHILNRQVRIEGRVESLDTESANYFQTRSRESQIGAWASSQSTELADGEILELQVAELTRHFEHEPVRCPPFWGGYLLRPDYFGF